MVVPSSNPNTFAGGQITDLPIFTGTLDGTELMEIVAPGNEEEGINYQLPINVLIDLIPIASNVPYTPIPPLSATNVQDAIDEVATDYAQIANLAAVAFSGAGADIASTVQSWTPALTFASPGDLNVAYAMLVGKYQKLAANIILVQFNITTSAFTFTTASGDLQITGLPFTASGTGAARGALSFGGINKAGYSQVALGISPTTNLLLLRASGMGQPAAGVAAADTPSGGTVTLNGEIIIFL